MRKVVQFSTVFLVVDSELDVLTEMRAAYSLRFVTFGCQCHDAGCFVAQPLGNPYK